MRRTVGVVCLRPVSRAMTWGPLAGGGAVGLAVTWYLRSRHLGSTASVAGVQVGAILIAAGAAFAIDDAAETTLASSPAPLIARRGVRLGLAAIASVAIWACLLVLAGVNETDAGALSLEAAGMAGVAVGTAAVAIRWAPRGLGGIVGGPALLITLITSFSLERLWPRWTVLLPPEPGAVWDDAHRHWLVLALVGAATVALSSQDPARPRVVDRLRGLPRSLGRRAPPGRGAR